MNSTDMYHAIVGLLTGILAGLFFFGGLWWTVSRFAQWRRPVLLMFASLMVRFSFLACCLAALARWGGWPATLAALLGVICTRFVWMRHVRAGFIERPAFSVSDAS